MDYKYDPTVTELRQAYEVAYGEIGAYHLIGALFANVSNDVVERLYRQALDKVKEDMDKMTVCVYCLTWFGAETQVCSECNEYDGMMVVSEAKKEGHLV